MDMVSHNIRNRIINRYYSTSRYLNSTGSEIMIGFLERVLFIVLGYWLAKGMPTPDCIFGWCQTVNTTT